MIQKETPETEQEQAGKKEYNAQHSTQSQKEVGGQSGPEPTRYGDWEKNGRCSDF